MNNEYLEVKHLKKYFQTNRGLLHAVDDVSFSVQKGQTVGVVGESGCGKSTMGRVIARLLDPTDGKVLLEGDNILNFKGRELKQLRRDVQMIFQDPYSSLNPRNTVYNTIAEPLRIQGICKSKDELEATVLGLMAQVGLAERLCNTYPHELDGGRRQRVCVARALALNPELIVCDEPVSALDVSIQAQILNLLKRLQQKYGYTYIFITHDLSVVKHISHQVIVMYLGQLVEVAPVRELFADPRHPYTEALLSAIPEPDIDHVKEQVLLKGEISSPINPKKACRFCKRCAYVTDRCKNEEPPVVEVCPGHRVRCFYPLKGKG